MYVSSPGTSGTHSRLELSPSTREVLISSHVQPSSPRGITVRQTCRHIDIRMEWQRDEMRAQTAEEATLVGSKMNEESIPVLFLL
jgi:hypothetical protein